MKKWSIKKKIVFLYTFFFAVLIGLDFYFLSSSASKILADSANREITNATIEVSGMIQMEDDGVYLEGNDDGDDQEGIFNFYHDGVLFLVYQSNQVAFGTIPTDFDATDPIEMNTVKTQEYNGMTWLVYDVAIEHGYVLRGIYDLSPTATSVQQILLTAGILSPILIILASIGGYLIIKRSFKPIQVIYQTASAITEEEDYSKRIPTQISKDEVYELGMMMNQMLDRVEQSISREKQFSSNVSHELRTPLTVMQAQAEYLLEQTKEKKIQNEIKTIISQISFMENIVTQLLEITRSRNISDDEMDPVEIYELIKLTGESFTQELNNKHISFEVKEPKFSTVVKSNQTMMIRVFSNLIVNAIKYNKDHGSISIDFKKENQNLVVIISDTGIGISKEHLDKIFDPFYRADESRTQNDFSLGLGLAMVREVVRIHNGDIQVQSVENLGTTFRVYLPLIKQ